MEKWKLRAIELVTGLAFTNKPNPAVIPFIPSKTKISEFEPRELRRSAPEEHGISSSTISSLLTELEAETRANLHNIMIVKDGEVISECSAPGYSVNIRHLSHSMSKTLTGIAVGLLEDEGRLSLDKKVTSFFPEVTPQDKKFSEITVRHLITMSSGVVFSELGTVTEEEWTKAFFSSKPTFAPGSMFAYNSMNSYILARIVSRITGMSLTDFLTVKLFNPLNIRNVFWEVGPEGVEKGGWGIHLSAESWAKIGIMMLEKGVYNGERILSEKWVTESTSTHMQAPERIGNFNYGYHVWVSKDADDFLFSGMLGQNVWVSPKNGIVVVTNSGNNELFQSNPTIELIRKYLGGDIPEGERFNRQALRKLRDTEADFYQSRHWVKAKEPLRGIPYRLGFKNPTPVTDEWKHLVGTYAFAKNTQSILPLFVRAMQNNYSGGISSFIFEREGHRFYLISKEGAAEHRIEIGLYGFKSSVLDFGGEKYIVNTLGEAAENDSGKLEYKIELIFPEMPNSRKIRLTTTDDGRMIIKMTELPNQKIAEPLVEGIYATSPKFAFIVSMLERRLGDRFLNRKLSSLFAPTLIAANTRSDSYIAMLASENSKSDKTIAETESVTALIRKYSELE